MKTTRQLRRQNNRWRLRQRLPSLEIENASMHEEILRLRRQSRAYAAAAVVQAVIIATVLMFAAGCGGPPPERTFLVRLVRSDGKVHREYRVRSSFRPDVYSRLNSGVQFITGAGIRDNEAPVGWLWEIEEEAESRPRPPQGSSSAPPAKRDPGVRPSTDPSYPYDINGWHPPEDSFHGSG